MTSNADEDIKANLFAMELLMPEQFVRTEIIKMKKFDLTDDKSMKALADKFKVPTTIMAMRVGQIYGQILPIIGRK